MANICTNMFYCYSENKENLQKVNDFLIENFSDDWYCDMEDENAFEGEFYSKWDFPQMFFDELTKLIDTSDNTLYMRCLSHELGNEYVSYRVFKNGTWYVKF